MKTTINIGLDVGSIESAIAQLDKLKQDINEKAKALVKETVERGTELCEQAVSSMPDRDVPIHGEWDGKNKGLVEAGGEAVFVEFGAGVRYNGPAGTSPHPMGEDFGFLIGEFGKKHGRNPEGWDYKDKSGNVVHTYGVKAQMFMYNAARQLEEEAPEIAKKVFTE